MPRLYGLDALRGIAALVVVTHHMVGWYGAGNGPILPALGVDLFFVISGFVMSRTYEDRLKRGMTGLQFVAKRYRRLFLPTAIGSTIGLLFGVIAYGPSISLVGAFLTVLAFMPAIWLANAFLLNMPIWSLFAEIVANALHGFIFSRADNRALVILWVGCGTVFCAGFFSGHMLWAADAASIALLLPRELACYLSGILVFRWFGARPLGHSPRIFVIAALAFLAGASLNPILEVACSLLVLPMIVRGVLAMRASAITEWTGAVSFPLYATHVPVISFCLFAGVTPLVAAVAVAAVALIVTVAVEPSSPIKPYFRQRGDDPRLSFR